MKGGAEPIRLHMESQAQRVFRVSYTAGNGARGDTCETCECSRASSTSIARAKSLRSHEFRFVGGLPVFGATASEFFGSARSGGRAFSRVRSRGFAGSV